MKATSAWQTGEWRIVLTALIVAGLVGILMHAAAGESERMTRRQAAAEARSIETGAELYALHCRACHGSRGEGVGQLGPALSEAKFFTGRMAEIGWQSTLCDYVVAVSTHGRLMATRPMYAGDGANAVMPPWLVTYGGPLRGDQIHDIARYVMNWRSTALGQVDLMVLEIPKINLDDPQTVSRGRQVFVQHCGRCHTVSGLTEATLQGPELSRAAVVVATRRLDLSAEDYIRESFLIPNAFRVEGFDPQTVGHSCGGVLSQREFDQVVAFLLTLK